MTQDDVTNYYEANKRLFHSNHRPSPTQVSEIFEMANFTDPNGGHKRSSCGRCYRNALRAIVEYVRKVTR